MMKTTKFSVTAPETLIAAFEKHAAETKQLMSDVIVYALVEHAERNDWDIGDFGFDIHLYRKLTMEVVEAAERIIGDGVWYEDITLRAIRDRANDPNWLARYCKLIGSDDPFVAGNKIKSSINQNIGSYIKVALSATVKTDEYGKRQTVQVKDDLVKTFTLLVKG